MNCIANSGPKRSKVASNVAALSCVKRNKVALREKVQMLQMRFNLIREANNSAFISCCIVYFKSSICMVIPTLTSRLLLGMSQLMPILYLAILMLYHSWVYQYFEVTGLLSKSKCHLAT